MCLSVSVDIAIFLVAFFILWDSKLYEINLLQSILSSIIAAIGSIFVSSFFLFRMFFLCLPLFREQVWSCLVVLNFLCIAKSKKLLVPRLKSSREAIARFGSSLSHVNLRDKDRWNDGWLVLFVVAAIGKNQKYNSQNKRRIFNRKSWFTFSSVHKI